MILPTNKELMFKNAAHVSVARTVRNELGDRLAIFCDDDGSTGASDLIDQGEALGFEMGSFDVTRHSRATMLRAATTANNSRRESRPPSRRSSGESRSRSVAQTASIRSTARRAPAATAGSIVTS